MPFTTSGLPHTFWHSNLTLPFKSFPCANEPRSFISVFQFHTSLYFTYFGNNNMEGLIIITDVLIFRAIHLTSPTLNYIITIGALTMYLSVIFALIPTKEKTSIKALCAVSKIHSRMFINSYIDRLRGIFDCMTSEGMVFIMKGHSIVMEITT